jgi:glyoxylase I family protein
MLVVTLILYCGLVLSQQPNQKPSSTTGSSIAVIRPNHIGITVHSIADALPFWNGILGLPLVYIYNSTDQPISTLVGVPGANISFFFLELPGGNRIELVEYTAARQEKRVYRPESCDVGSVHVSLDVRGLDEIVRKAKGVGWNVVGGGPVVILDRRRAVYLRSINDGTTVELFEGAVRDGLTMP